ncbi:antA/AntB antirepressor family protein [Exercitatus varius]|uniref:antA/AntB antirepressor family protein n=1 Tax=Exercitatus varius TaxID=67857 RepID=UPI00294B22DD|nr:antA/AntB antirepressor family protein [Exercitatus varius]MDG2958866.1 antA/AntB antirepressor family protein [Exercitatus varius]
MKTFQISTFNGAIQNQSVQLVNARELHQILENGKQFTDWIQHRISKYGFTENLDFIGVHQIVNVESGFFGLRQKEIKEYHLTLDMAKELCMLERSELGKQARRYFIEMEKQSKQLALQLQEQIKLTYLATNPEAKRLLRYRNAGLTTAEMAKLMNLSESQVTARLAKMIQLGFFERKNGNQYVSRQLALFA